MQTVIKEDHDDEINPLDMHFGLKLRMRRLGLNLTQDKLGKLVGLTFQQVQKYEHGQNRISASRLLEIAKALKVPVTYFFEDAPSFPMAHGMSESEQDPIEKDAASENVDFSSRETSDLIRAYYRIKDTNRRKKVLDLIRAMADEE